jgi:hypothetical protein
MHQRRIQVTSRSLVLDPFVGTGSLLVSAAHWGAYCVGTDIDYHTILGKGDEKTIQANFRQYKLRQPDILRADQSNPCYRSSSMSLPDMQVDAILCDPPYGVWPSLACVLGCAVVAVVFFLVSKVCSSVQIQSHSMHVRLSCVARTLSGIRAGAKKVVNTGKPVLDILDEDGKPHVQQMSVYPVEVWYAVFGLLFGDRTRDTSIH